MASPDKAYYEKLVYETLFPRSDSKDPPNFEEFVRNYILKEVRWENVRYFGRESDRGEQLDALYPGHDYSSAKARLRLGCFQSHRRLFQAFDELGLKPYEIDMLCNWEGTKSARDRYEEQHKTKIVDPMWASYPPPAARRSPIVTHHESFKPTPGLYHSTLERIVNTVPTTPPRRIKRDYYSNRAIWGDPLTTVVYQMISHPQPPLTPTSIGSEATTHRSPELSPDSWLAMRQWQERNTPRTDPRGSISGMPLQEIQYFDPPPQLITPRRDPRGSTSGVPPQELRFNPPPQLPTPRLSALRHQNAHLLISPGEAAHPISHGYQYNGQPYRSARHERNTSPTPRPSALRGTRDMPGPRHHHFQQQIRAQTARALQEVLPSGFDTARYY